MDSLLALEQFIEHWRDRPGFLVDPFGNATFRARVEYRSPLVRDHHSTVVRIRRRGHDSGKVSLQKQPGLFQNFSHVDFTPLRHRYEYRGPDHALLIRALPDQAQADYVVRIMPA